MSFYLPRASEYWSRDPPHSHTLSYKKCKARAWRFERGIIDELESHVSLLVSISQIDVRKLVQLYENRGIRTMLIFELQHSYTVFLQLIFCTQVV